MLLSKSISTEIHLILILKQLILRSFLNPNLFFWNTPLSSFLVVPSLNVQQDDFCNRAIRGVVWGQHFRVFRFVSDRGLLQRCQRYACP